VLKIFFFVRKRQTCNRVVEIAFLLFGRLRLRHRTPGYESRLSKNASGPLWVCRYLLRVNDLERDRALADRWAARSAMVSIGFVTKVGGVTVNDEFVP